MNVTRVDVSMAVYNPSVFFAVVHFLFHLLMTLAIVIGIPSNIFVLVRMCRLSRECVDVYSNGVGVCLFVMAVADIVSLSAISAHVFISFLSISDLHSILALSPVQLGALCKIIIFTMHVSTCLSIWTWLLMSTLRFLSVYYPLLYIRLWRLPGKVLLSVLAVAVLSNFWLLIVVVVDNSSEVQTLTCSHNPLLDSPLINRGLLLVDSFFTFLLPTSIIVVVDFSAFSFSFRNEGRDKCIRRNTSGRISRHSSLLPRWLLIALVDVGLNTPENVLRLLSIVGVVNAEDGHHHPTYFLIKSISQALYYSQFGFNAVYLALFIFDKSTRPMKRGWVMSEMGEATPNKTDQIGNAPPPLPPYPPSSALLPGTSPRPSLKSSSHSVVLRNDSAHAVFASDLPDVVATTGV